MVAPDSCNLQLEVQTMTSLQIPRWITGPLLNVECLFEQLREQLSCLTKVGFEVFALLPSLFIFVRAKNDVSLFILP
jgi:hypothetical protein